MITVEDNGIGLASEDQAMIFDRFHQVQDTESMRPHGTGLGLAIVQGVVADMGGIVWVEDAREGGAAFKVFLPAETDVGRPAADSGPAA